jgi:hypothetical protein
MGDFIFIDTARQVLANMLLLLHSLTAVSTCPLVGDLVLLYMAIEAGALLLLCVI